MKELFKYLEWYSIGLLALALIIPSDKVGQLMLLAFVVYFKFMQYAVSKAPSNHNIEEV